VLLESREFRLSTAVTSQVRIGIRYKLTG
jgi:hypothetical protein